MIFIRDEKTLFLFTSQRVTPVPASAGTRMLSNKPVAFGWLNFDHYRIITCNEAIFQIYRSMQIK